MQDKVEGREFTVTGLTDGKNLVITPTTFDYPYRFDEDKGPGTGGMGCLSFETGLLPFLNQEDINKCAELMKKVIELEIKQAKMYESFQEENKQLRNEIDKMKEIQEEYKKIRMIYDKCTINDAKKRIGTENLLHLFIEFFLVKLFHKYYYKLN